MDSIILQVSELGDEERRFLERALGQPLGDEAQVTLGVTHRAAPMELPPSSAEVPSWWNVYDGLSEAEVDELDAAIRQRANLTRVHEE